MLLARVKRERFRKGVTFLSIAGTVHFSKSSQIQVRVTVAPFWQRHLLLFIIRVDFAAERAKINNHISS